MPVVQERNPSQVRLVENRLNDAGDLDVRVETAELGDDNAASLHVYDEHGHITDLALAPATPGAHDAFVGSVSIGDLKAKGFDVATLHEQAFTTCKNATLVYWGDPDQYDAKRYRARVDDAVWRGSSINDAADFADLMATAKPKTIVALRERSEAKFNDDEALAASWNAAHPGEHVDVARIPFRDFSVPTEDQLRAFLGVLANKDAFPLYVHCRAGMGRTGVMVAVYRMACDGFPLDRAIAEARSLGLSDPAQIAFLATFAGRLQRGEFAGFPRR